eukprot:365279-Chlamydomonas_euryale.AAC.6
MGSEVLPAGKPREDLHHHHVKEPMLPARRRSQRCCAKARRASSPTPKLPLSGTMQGNMPAAFAALLLAHQYEFGRGGSPSTMSVLLLSCCLASKRVNPWGTSAGLPHPWWIQAEFRRKSIELCTFPSWSRLRHRAVAYTGELWFGLCAQSRRPSITPP